MAYIPAQLCQLPELGLSCVGCCGSDFKNKKDVELGIRKNTLEFESSNNPLDFRDRTAIKSLRDCGVCRNLVKIKSSGAILCPLHPSLHEGIDHREGHCNIGFVCLTSKNYSSWDSPKQERFIRFLELEELDWYTYSLGIDSGTLLRRFEEWETRSQKKRSENILR